jgi:hypothetical protein
MISNLVHALLTAGLALFASAEAAGAQTPSIWSREMGTGSRVPFVSSCNPDFTEHD